MEKQMRLLHDGEIVLETPEMLAEEGNAAERKQKLDKASDTVIELMGRDTEKNWVNLYLIIAEVEEEQLYRPEYKSITAWGKALAERGGFHLRELWRRKRAGETYREYERRKEALGKNARPLEQVTAQTKSVNPRNLETIVKIAGGDKKMEERLIDQLAAGKIGRSQLEGMWESAKGAGAKTRKNQYDEAAQDDVQSRAMTAARIVAAIQNANDGTWLPEEHKKRPWIKDKYRVFTEVPVYTGSTDRPARIDAVTIETFGCEYMTDVVVHAIEIKVSESDLMRDVKMGEYADFADYMWVAVPEELKEAAENHIDELQGSQTWGLLLIKTDPETEEDHLLVARKPKLIKGIMRGKVCEYLVAQYI
jgi:hypothetical protein